MKLREACQVLSRAARLRCPRCGERSVFRGVFATHRVCPACGLTLERESGYVAGAIYLTYAGTAAVAIAGFLGLRTAANLSTSALVALCGAVAVALPPLLFRHAKSLWLALDYLLHPEKPNLRLVHKRSA